jgi:hypothetical protein
LVSLVVGTVLFLDIVLVRLLFRATPASVFFLGNSLGEMCEFKRRSGFPCPTCGATRGFILSISGHFAQGWRLNPLGPLLAWGLIGVALLLMAMAFVQRSCSEETINRIIASVRKSLVVYGAFSCLVWMVSWMNALAAASHRPNSPIEGIPRKPLLSAPRSATLARGKRASVDAHSSLEPLDEFPSCPDDRSPHPDSACK